MCPFSGGKSDFAKELIEKTISNGADIGTNTSSIVLWGIGATWIENYMKKCEKLVHITVATRKMDRKKDPPISQPIRVRFNNSET